MGMGRGRERHWTTAEGIRKCGGNGSGRWQNYEGGKAAADWTKILHVRV